MLTPATVFFPKSHFAMFGSYSPLKVSVSMASKDRHRFRGDRYFCPVQTQPPYSSMLCPVLPHLEGFDEGPQQGPNPFPARQQLHQPHHAEQPEEGDGDPGVLFRVLQSLLVGFGVFCGKKHRTHGGHMQKGKGGKTQTHTRVHTHTSVQAYRHALGTHSHRWKCIQTCVCTCPPTHAHTHTHTQTHSVNSWKSASYKIPSKSTDTRDLGENRAIMLIFFFTLVASGKNT